ILFEFLAGKQSASGLPHILRHMDQVDNDEQGDVPFLRQLLETINLREIAIHQSHPQLLSLSDPGAPPPRTSPESLPPATAPGWPRPVWVGALAARAPVP